MLLVRWCHELSQTRKALFLEKQKPAFRCGLTLSGGISVQTPDRRWSFTNVFSSACGGRRSVLTARMNGTRRTGRTRRTTGTATRAATRTATRVTATRTARNTHLGRISVLSEVEQQQRGHPGTRMAARPTPANRPRTIRNADKEMEMGIWKCGTASTTARRTTASRPRSTQYAEMEMHAHRGRAHPEQSRSTRTTRITTARTPRHKHNRKTNSIHKKAPAMQTGKWKWGNASENGDAVHGGIWKWHAHRGCVPVPSEVDLLTARVPEGGEGPAVAVLYVRDLPPKRDALEQGKALL